MNKIACVSARKPDGGPVITGELRELEEIIRSAVGQWPPPEGVVTSISLHFHELTEEAWEQMPEFES